LRTTDAGRGDPGRKFISIIPRILWLSPPT
jgi:hypothetical protein